MSVELLRSPRIVVAGAVQSTRRILEGLLRNGADVVGVLGLSEKVSANVSGYERFDDLAHSHNIPYADFERINDSDIVELVRQWAPDLFFGVGFSQLVKQELLDIPRIGAVGFHPTLLPEGRGRAPIPWLILNSKPGAASFFLMDDGVDSGPLLAQEPFEVCENDYSDDLLSKMNKAIDVALDRWIPELVAGKWDPVPQVGEAASENGRRTPEDGWIDWKGSAKNIYALIRAASRPLPGAYTYVNNDKLIIWRAAPENEIRCQGVPGRVLRIDEEQGALVQTGDGLLWLTEVEGPALKVGMRMGYVVEDEIQALRRQVAELERRLRDLET